MGLEHGSYCLGCCWFLIGLLFFGGIMNLFWIAGLAAFPVGKDAPDGPLARPARRHRCRSLGCRNVRRCREQLTA
jgi:predicted metal-binding membrane protein